MASLSLVLKERHGDPGLLPYSPKEIVQHLCHNQARKRIGATPLRVVYTVGFPHSQINSTCAFVTYIFGLQ